MGLFDWITSMRSSAGSPEEEAVVRAAFESSHPGCKVVEVKRQGKEGDTQYIAIVYKPKLPTRPLPYKLFALTGKTVEEVEIADHPQFAIKGRK